jgi:hypothetical protein
MDELTHRTEKLFEGLTVLRCEPDLPDCSGEYVAGRMRSTERTTSRAQEVELAKLEGVRSHSGKEHCPVFNATY